MVSQGEVDTPVLSSLPETGHHLPWDSRVLWGWACLQEPLAHRGASLLTEWAPTVLVAAFEVSAFFFPAPFKLMSPSGATRSPAILRLFTVTEIKWRGRGIKLPGRVDCLLQLFVVTQINSSYNSLLTNCKLLYWEKKRGTEEQQCPFDPDRDAHFQSTIICFHFYT